ncbi:MAG: hypothetical protein NUV50_09820 [Rhodospirillales bacterium]|nr:hypothetical protein [Rhodospirillales bacterium]
MIGEDLVKKVFSVIASRAEERDKADTVVEHHTTISQPMEVNLFAQRIKAQIKSHGEFLSGSVQMLGLSRLKNHFGDDWPHVSAKVHALIQSTMSTRLDKADCYTLFGESTYVIVFSNLSASVAGMKAALIAEEVSRRLFGDKPPKSLFKIGVAKVSGDSKIAFETLGSTELISNIASLHKRECGFVEVSVGPAEQGDKDASAGRTAPPLHTDTKPAGQESEWIPIHTAKAENADLYSWRPIRHQYEMPADLMFVYWPAWLVNQEMIAAHTCVPARVAERGIVIAGGGAMPMRHASVENFSLDLHSLTKVIDNLNELERQRRQAIVILPVHVHTLEASKYRDPYKDILTALSGSQRAKIVFELIGIDHTTPTLNIAHAVSMLRPFAKDLMIRTKLNAANFVDYQSLGVHAVGVDLSGIKMTEKEIYPQLNAFNARANKHHLCTFAHGIRTRSLTSGAAAAGFRYIDGGAIATPIMMPEPGRSWGARDVYSALIEDLNG